MSTNSSIEWTDTTWNPVTGCTKVSPGCAHCYAETFAERFRGVPGHPFEQGFDLKLWPERLSLPLSWKKPRRIFVNSMSDLFHEGVPFEFIDRVFAVMALAPQHTFQVLTKRPERMRRYAQERATSDEQRVEVLFQAVKSLGVPFVRPELEAWPLPNVWLGTSTENQHWLDIRVPELLATPAAVRFLSCEPLLGPLEMRGWFDGDCSRCAGTGEDPVRYAKCRDCAGGGDSRGVDWVIVGGESGPKARSMDVGWARSIVEQCRAAGVACFVKQLGAKPFTSNAGLAWADVHPVTTYRLKSRKGGDIAEWPVDLRVREMPV